MKNVFVALVCVLFVHTSCGQSKDFTRDMEVALALEDTASSFGAVLKATKTLEGLTKNYPGQWLALYWTAHAYSQTALFTGDHRYGPYLDTAEVYFDQAWASLPKKSKTEEAEFHVLKANLHSLRIGYYQRRGDQDHLRKQAALREEALEKAETANPNNPRLWMIKGIGLMGNPVTREQGRALLEEAIKKYEQFPPTSPIHPNWGRAWIGYWLGRYPSDSTTSSGQASSLEALQGVSEVDQERATPHFVLRWQASATTPEEAEEAQRRAEDLFSKIAAYLGPQHTPAVKLTLFLEGDAERQDGTYNVPYVDTAGRIHLYRYRGGRYFEELAHEMVHAFRSHTHTQSADGFVEEAIASLVAYEVYPEATGSPLYGYPLAVAAGQWVATQQDIPLRLLQRHHREINLKCSAQAYTLRMSFFTYLRHTFGKEAVLRLAYTKPVSLSRYEEVFGPDFDTLVEHWREDLLGQFSALDKALQRGQDYREKTPLQYRYICQAGQDF